MGSLLKSLELQGYKTFASRMNFEFPAKITAIVGPNGAGKSNIADSIRWVLGEQSYSLLRGRKTEDMIFAGSEQRPRASMASATITFNNESGWLPIDFIEVSITRRAYRDGQNEYLLNGQRVRLKEISELLAKSGLAERTYTIIGQGLVDAALSLKPDERRRFFEEAAGIGLYRSRREESLNRLENTQRNLLRVQDILSELEPRLKSLERQARRAQEYEQIKADLQLLLRDWYGYHWHRTQQELLRARQVYREQENRLRQARARQLEVESKMELSRRKLQEIRSQLNQWHAESAGLHQEREKLSRSLAVMDERQRTLGEQLQNLQNEQSHLEEEQKTWQERILAQQEELQRLQEEQAEAQLQLGEVRQRLAERQSQRAKIELALRDARRAVVAAETHQVELNAHKNELSSRLEALLKNRATYQKNLAPQMEAEKTAQQALEELRQQREQAEANVKSVEEALQHHRDEVEALERRQKNTAAELAQTQAEKARLQAQREVLEQAERSFSGLNQGARFVLEAARQGRLQGVYQPVSSVLEVPAAYEVAVAAVLGEILDGVLIEDTADAEPALVLLEQGKHGRAVLLPLQARRLAAGFQFSNDSDAIGVAAELVQTPQRYRSLVDQLLGQAVIVKNRAAARQLAAQFPANACAVTLQGEIFWGSGVVIAGQDGRSGMVARPRQKKELSIALEKIEKDIEETRRQIRTIEQDLAQQREQGNRLGQSLRQANQRLREAVQAYQKATLELERVRQRNKWQKEQLAGLEEQISKTEEESRRLTDELQQVAGGIVAARQRVRENVGALEGIPLDELQAQEAHWNTSLAVARRALQDAKTRLEEYQQAFNNNQQRQQAATARLAETGQAVQQLEREKAEKHTLESQLNQQIELLHQKIGPAEDELEQVENENAELQADLVAAQQAVTLAERYATQAQLELSRQRDALDSLRRRVEEDFGLVTFENNERQMSLQTPLPLGEMVNQLPMVNEIPAELEENIRRQRALLRRMGAINPEAQSEYQAVKERFEFMTSQVEDLKKADQDLRKIIAELDDLMRKEFRKTFDAVAVEFKQMFTRLFGGGTAQLVLTDEENPSETGIDIEARLPGRREQGLSLLSGGERSLTAVALIFALLKVSPTPFCVLDEVDAMLDEANVGRFCELLQELSQKTQFIVITHNRNTVQTADVIYGVTMGHDSASQIISLKLDELSEEMVQ